MAYISKGVGNGTLYIGHVKWSNDYKNTMLFSNKNARDSFFTSRLKKVLQNVAFIDPNKYVDIKGKLENVESYNYCYFVNDDEISSTPYCCFITNFEFLNCGVTRLHLSLDVFQMYVYDTVFYSSFIERGHVRDDKVGKWVAPEPFTLSSDYTKQIDTFNHDWGLVWLMNSVSTPIKMDFKTFHYGGLGTREDLTGVYAHRLLTADEIQEEIAKFVDGANDHRADITGLTAAPAWALSSTGFIDKLLTSNALASVSSSVSLNGSTLANGFKPKNNKLLTSIGRCYAVYNKNGFCKVFKPELFSGNPTITLKARPIGLTEIKGSVSNYSNVADSNFSLPYSASLTVGYNQNTGVIGTLNKVGSILGAVGAVGNIATSFSNPVSAIGGVASGANNLMQAGLSVYQSFQEKTAGGGSATNTTSISPDYIKLRFLEVNPLYQECFLADDFFNMYGYAIKEIYNAGAWLHTRKNWNYLKTQSINLASDAPTDYENELKNIFNAGVTMWHNYNTYGDYNEDNSPI